MFRDMPAIPGASEALWRLSDAGVWLRVITHRLVTGLRAKDWDEVEEIVAELVAQRSGSFATQLPGVDPGADRIARRAGT